MYTLVSTYASRDLAWFNWAAPVQSVIALRTSTHPPRTYCNLSNPTPLFGVRVERFRGETQLCTPPPATNCPPILRSKQVN